MKLEYLPEGLFVKMPGETWAWSKELGPGVVGLTSTQKTWYLDAETGKTAQRGKRKDGKTPSLGISREGYILNSALTGTAHSFAGDTLSAAIVDCFPWGRRGSPPERDRQIAAYMMLSRVRKLEYIYVTEA